MHRSLWVLGFLTAAAGFVTIGFGIAPSTLSFGNFLIVAGTTAVVGGFILMGLAAVVSQLKRIADMESRHPAIPTFAPTAVHDRFDPRAAFEASQVTQGLAPATSGPNARLLAAQEPKTASAPATEPNPVEWLRPRDKEPTLGERAVIEEFEASLAPQASPPPIPEPPAPPRQANVTSPPRMPRAPTEPLPPVTPASRTAPVPRPAVPSDRPGAGLFDSVWPEMRPSRNAERIERVRGKPEPGAPARDAGVPVKEAAPAAHQASTADESRPVAILKSGMIDGMAYTLFADGSIEAVLPTGTLRFASVDALRLHLERNS
jgi:hypothetical protein